MHSKIVNKTRYVDPEKIMKQTSSTVKNFGGRGGGPSRKAIHYSKKKFQI